ncbi:MAG: hypothetical protein R3A12_06510 [Ignavibacteria bacterium]
MRIRSSKLDATFILVLIGLVMVTMLGMSTEKILLGTSEGYRPVSTVSCRILQFRFSCNV